MLTVFKSLTKACRFFTQAVRDRLFQEADKPYSGTDLVALNIQRGRDHGLQPYFQYRKKYNMPVPVSFDDLDEAHLNIMYNDDVYALKTVSTFSIQLFRNQINSIHIRCIKFFGTTLLSFAFAAFLLSGRYIPEQEWTPMTYIGSTFVKHYCTLMCKCMQILFAKFKLGIEV
jgi:hypothetical protein